MTPRTCPVCGAEFTPQYKNKRYCSRACYLRVPNSQRLNLEQRVCRVCGEAFTPTAPHQRYCSEACRETAKNALARKRRARGKMSCKQTLTTYYRGRNPGGFSAMSREKYYLPVII